MLLPKPKPKPAIDIEAEAIEEEISAEAQRRSQMLEQVSRFAKEKPEVVARAVLHDADEDVLHRRRHLY